MSQKIAKVRRYVRAMAGFVLSLFNIAVLKTRGLCDCVHIAFSYLDDRTVLAINAVREKLVLCFHILQLSFQKHRLVGLLCAKRLTVLLTFLSMLRSPGGSQWCDIFACTKTMLVLFSRTAAACHVKKTTIPVASCRPR